MTPGGREMRFLEELLYLSYLSGVGRSAINDGFVPWLRWRMKNREKPAEASFRLAEEWLRETHRVPPSSDAEEAEEKTRRTLDWMAAHEEVWGLTVFDEDYPSRLRVMGNQQPVTLYVKGGVTALKGRFVTSDAFLEKEIFSLPSLAVIGSRWPGEYTLVNGPAFARKLAKQSGMPIVSGLARGCDRMGHLSAIQSGIPTIAVMPCGLDLVVPEFNRDLAADIIDGKGFLMTEYPPGTPPAEYRYVERDRVTAALSSAAVVVECGVKSGTMQTVRAALSFGRPVACWYPEGADFLGFEGNRYMIEQLGAFRLHDAASLEEFLDKVRRSEQDFAGQSEQISIF